MYVIVGHIHSPPFGGLDRWEALCKENQGRRGCPLIPADTWSRCRRMLFKAFKESRRNHWTVDRPDVQRGKAAARAGPKGRAWHAPANHRARGVQNSERGTRPSTRARLHSQPTMAPRSAYGHIPPLDVHMYSASWSRGEVESPPRDVASGDLVVVCNGPRRGRTPVSTRGGVELGSADRSAAGCCNGHTGQRNENGGTP